jgi:hypothetical protein
MTGFDLIETFAAPVPEPPLLLGLRRLAATD